LSLGGSPASPPDGEQAQVLMRILKSVQAYYPFQEKGGPVVKVRAIARGLAARAHSVTVYTADHGFDPTSAPEMQAEKCRWGWRAREEGVETIYLNSLGHYRGVTFNPRVISFAAGSCGNFDLAHVYGLYDLLGPAFGYYCRRRRIPYVVEPMGMFRPIVRNLRMKKLYHRIFGNRLLSGAYRLIATSEQEKEELISGGFDPVRVIVRHNGVEAPACLPEAGEFRRRWGISPETRLILFLGRIVPKKSPDLLIEAYAGWRRESREGGESKLILAGPEEGNGYGDRLKSLAHSAGVADHVIFTGPLYNATKWAAYRDADVFILPSLNENFGNSAAEAIACGTPVIVTAECGIAPMVDRKCGLVVPHDSAAVTAALRLLLGNAELTARFRTGCAELRHALSWNEPLRKMEELYREAIREAAGA
jgi:glycosyltransferase involved in cell wall biosynthesis